MRSVVGLALVLTAATHRPARGQTCAEPHYRWSEKIDTSLAHEARTTVQVSDILGWAPPRITAKDVCAPRAGRERNVYTVTAWVRRVKLHELDGDAHLEITEEEHAPVAASCIIAEIPAPTYGAIFGQARDQFARLVDTTRLTTRGDLSTPVRVSVTAAAFFDGYHQKQTAAGARASGHGRCNSSIQALWELHPVYAVSAPPAP